MRARIAIVTLLLTLALIPTLGHAAILGNPSHGGFYSGIGVISGWKCEANGPLTVRFNGGEPIPLVYGSQRPDVLEAGACAHDRAGFVAIWNWARLGDGQHTAVAYDNGVEFDRSTFTVGTLGEEFVRGARARVEVPDFPAPGEQTPFTWNESTQHLEITPPAPLPTKQERPDLYRTIPSPQALATVYWIWRGSTSHDSIEMDITLHNNVDDFSDRHGLYLILAQSAISNIGFYFGLQTDVARPGVGNSGKGVIFSRWETRDLSNARLAPDGFSESSGHEGDFIGIRRPYAWSAGEYRARLARHDSDSLGDWFGLWLTDTTRGRTTWIGSLRFPRSQESPAEIAYYLISHVEVYGHPIRLIDIPQWHVSLAAPLGEWDVAPSYTDTIYQVSQDGSAIRNAEMWYQADENRVHIRVGGGTERQTLQPGPHNRYWLPPVE